MPYPVIRHSYASPSTAAWGIHQKYELAVPLYRQENKWKDPGVTLSRVTMSNWIPASYRDCLSPIVGLLRKRRKNTTDTSSTNFKEDTILNAYLECPTIKTKSFTIRLIRKADSESLFQCYNDERAVCLMNDDNCDFGFYVESREKMLETIGYWLDFYEKQYFIRFSIVDNATDKAVGTIEGFVGETGVLRVDISSDFEKASCLSEILEFAKDNFYDFFGNEVIVTKAVPGATERRKALNSSGWEFIDKYREHHDYYKITCKQ